jgi:hypothetical protein
MKLASAAFVLLLIQQRWDKSTEIVYRLDP